MAPRKKRPKKSTNALVKTARSDIKSVSKSTKTATKKVSAKKPVLETSYNIQKDFEPILTRSHRRTLESFHYFDIQLPEEVENLVGGSVSTVAVSPTLENKNDEENALLNINPEDKIFITRQEIKEDSLKIDSYAEENVVDVASVVEIQNEDDSQKPDDVEVNESVEIEGKDDIVTEEVFNIEELTNTSDKKVEIVDNIYDIDQEVHITDEEIIEKPTGEEFHDENPNEFVVSAQEGIISDCFYENTEDFQNETAVELVSQLSNLNFNNSTVDVEHVKIVDENVAESENKTLEPNMNNVDIELDCQEVICGEQEMVTDDSCNIASVAIENDIFNNVGNNSKGDYQENNCVNILETQFEAKILDIIRTQPIFTDTKEEEVYFKEEDVNKSLTEEEDHHKMVSDTKPTVVSQKVKSIDHAKKLDKSSEKLAMLIGNETLIRRSSRIKSISALKQKSHGRGLVKHKIETFSDTSDNSNSAQSELEKSHVLETTSFPCTLIGSEQKPVKVKSRWRRSSELEMTGNLSPCPSSESPQIEVPQAVVNVDEKVKVDEEVERRLKQFVHLKENQYLTERVSCKEAKRMTCDCFLTEEELTQGEYGCGEDCLNRLLMIEW